MLAITDRAKTAFEKLMQNNKQEISVLRIAMMGFG